MCSMVDVARRDYLGSITSHIQSDISGVYDRISAASREKVAAGRHSTRNRHSMAAVWEAGGALIADVEIFRSAGTLSTCNQFSDA